jgi:hypothetical protein
MSSDTAAAMANHRVGASPAAVPTFFSDLQTLERRESDFGLEREGEENNEDFVKGFCFYTPL